MTWPENRDLTPEEQTRAYEAEIWEEPEPWEPPNCPLVTGLRPCMCDLPRCPVCNYTEHDARFEGDHLCCKGAIPKGRVKGGEG